jgi:tyrosine-protein kinase Etk/Wzc
VESVHNVNATAGESLDSSVQQIRLGGEISISALGSALVQGRRFILRAVLGTAALAAAIAFLIPVKYSAEAVILTPQQSQSSLSAMAQLAGIGSASSGLSALSLLSGVGLRNPTDLYIGILQSRTIADRIISTYNLRQVYDVEDYHLARKKLAKYTTIKAGRDTLIHIKVEDREPGRAAQLANAYVEELSRQNSQTALTEASQRRLFFETQLAKEKDALSDAEIALRDTQNATGLVSPTGQAEALIRTVAQLKAEVLGHEAQAEAMKTYAADDNPRFQMVKKELGVLRAELTRLEAGQHTPGTPEVPVGQLPEVGLRYLRRYRDVKYHEALFEILSKQYEAARLDEAKAAPMIQEIDHAVTPERRSWPPRTVIVVTASILALLISGFWVMWNSKLLDSRA